MVERTIDMQHSRLRRRGWLIGMGLAAWAALPLAGCYGRSESLFTRLVEARRVAAELRLQFNKAADASNLAVMSDIKDTTVGFAAEAEAAKQALRREAAELQDHLRTLGFKEELGFLAEFQRSFAEYEKLDQATLRLAHENTNLRARKLAFGAGREDADLFRDALDSVAAASSQEDRCRVNALVHAAVASIRELQVLELPHIAEADDLAMTKLEKEMERLEATVRSSLQELSALAARSAGDRLADANAAFDRFEKTHREVLALSRKNTNVLTLAMSLGQKRAVSAACDGSLAELQRALGKRGLEATR